MKKLKLILLFVLSAMLVSALSFVVACKEEHQHTFDEANWSTSATEHWHAATCEHTDEVSAKANHDLDANGVCKVCHYQHTHTYATTWSTSATEHWHAATCTHDGTFEDKADKGTHSFGTGSTCSVCKYERTNATYESLRLDISNVKTEYYIGESFSSTGIGVVAVYSDTTTSDVQLRRVTIDSSAFDKNTVGKYTINVSYAIDGVTKTADYSVNVNSAEISVDISEANLQTFVGEDLATSGVKVNLHVTKPEATEVETTDITADAKIDWSVVNKNKAGKYTVEVSYSVSSALDALTASIDYTVLEVMEGIELTILEGIVSGTYQEAASVVTISEDKFEASLTIDYGAKATLDLSKLTVKRTDKYGKVPANATALTEGVTYKVYNKQTEVTAVEGVYSLSEGVYQIWASVASEIEEDYILSAFVLINVVEDVTLVDVTKIEWKEGTLTQELGETDSITSTWKFTATYSDTTTKEVTAADLNEFVIDTKHSGQHTVNVSFTDKNVREEETTVKCDVTYEITLDPTKTYTFEYESDFTAITGKTDQQALVQSDFVGDNDFITVVEATDSNKRVVNYRTSDSGILEIRLEALQVTLAGKGTIVINARSTNDTNLSTIAVKNSAGDYVAATYTDTNVGKDATSNIYSVTGTGYRELTFTVDKAGVYTICTFNSFGSTATGRNTRIGSIKVTDVIKGESASADDVSYELIIDTTAVKKDYIAGEATQIDSTGLVAKLKETHSINTSDNKETDVTANCTVALTAGDLTKLNTTGTVTVSYVYEQKTYTKTYEINIKSPVTGVNSVAAYKENVIYKLGAESTVTVATTDITLKANNASGNAITPDTEKGESVTYKLYDGETALDTYAVGAGTYRLEVTVILNNTAVGADEQLIVSGTTTFTANITVKVKEQVVLGETQAKETFFLANAGSGDDFTLEQYLVGEDIAVNTLFSLTANVAMETSYGASYGNIQASDNALSFNDKAGTAHNPDVGIKQGADIASNATVDSVLSVTAKENITLTLYVVFTNNSYNSHRADAKIVYANGEDKETVTAEKRSTAVKVEVTLKQGETLTVGATAGASSGRLWLFGAEATLTQSAD